MKTYTAYSAVR